MRTTTKRISTVAVGLFLAATIGILSTIPTVPTPAEARMPTQEQGTEPTPIDPGPGTEYLGPALWSILQAEANDQGVPPRITIELGVNPAQSPGTGLGKFIRSLDGKKVAEDTWDVPTDQALKVVQRPDVYRAVLVRDGVSGQVTIPANLDDTLGEVVKAHDRKVTAESAALHAMFAKGESVVVAIKAPNAATITSIRSWLSGKNVYVVPASQTGGVSPKHLAVLLPVEHISDLAQAYSTTRFEVASWAGQGLTLSRTNWPQEAKDIEAGIVSQYEQASSSASDLAVTDPGSTTKEWEVDLERKLKLHGVDQWHDAQLTGKGVKVGIIDWSFTGWNTNTASSGLPRMVVGAENNVAGANAYCQPVTESIIPDSVILFGISRPCQAISNRIDPIIHGTHVAELVRDVAPNAELFMAQANSPRQVYVAASWLRSKNVDVIVHAAGWPYDGRGDGTSPFGLSHWSDSSLADEDENSPRRYYPSPLYTVDQIAGRAGGPVWINAAGNAEEWTLNLTKPALVNSSGSKYHGYVIFHPKAKKQSTQTCQRVPITAFNIYYVGMRWADTWPNGQQNLDYEMQRFGALSGQGFVVRSQDREQHTTTTINYPVRRTPITTWWGFDVCLRIRVHTTSGQTPASPAWIQFQAFPAREAFETSPNWARGIDSAGGSIVNPAESAQRGLLAVGARNLRTPTPADVFDYSSRGPVYSSGANILTGSPTSKKPDVAAGSGAATYTKWLSDCNKDASTCGEELYFAGTSAATAHTGGLAALVVGWFDELGISSSAVAVADYLQGIAVDEGAAGQDNTWGWGFLELPCPPEEVSLPYTSSGANWRTSDCDPENLSSGKADYYTFSVPSSRQVTIDLTTAANAKLSLMRGIHGRGTVFATDATSGGAAQIRMNLTKGTYTLEVGTTNAVSSPVGYALKITNMAPVRPQASLSPDPSTFKFTPDGEWHTFTLSANLPVEVIANPTGTDLRMEIASTKPSRSYCPPEPNDDITRTNGQTLVLAACSAGTGVVEVRNANDDSVIVKYTMTVAAQPTTPVTPVTPTPRGSLSPNPNGVSFKADGKWKTFTVSSNMDVEVEANPTGTTPIVEITSSSNAGNHCSNGAESGDDVDASNGDTVYLAGCKAGTGTVRVLRESDSKVLSTYSVKISAVTVPQICKPVTGLTVRRVGRTAVKATWANPTGGLTSTGRSLEVREWDTVGRRWDFVRFINEPAGDTLSWHTGASADRHYAYRVTSKCGGNSSLPSGWRTVAPIPSDSAQGAGGEDMPTPTPVPDGASGTSRENDTEDERPPTPR